ncbi:MAG: right-handed parallel beta-helix repeat-containing protein [Dokdonella sp.]|nr:right-handed parallel beta-helix repeat-containing protein [Xanthomonadales bacterium]MCB1573763.1 right-handed parallel beta-helix repeat-containing protein [Xanthomonadales bacterium]
MSRSCLRLIVVVLFGLFASGLVHAQATRTWVSGVGDDANPCSRTAPCKTFAGAISKTAAGGTIDVLDPGGFGAVTITKSITIEADGSIGSAGVSNTNGINVNAGATDIVTLRGLKIVGLGSAAPGLKGISVSQVGSLVIEGVQIENFTTGGIDLSLLTSAATVNVRDTVVRNCGGTATSINAGIVIRPAVGGSANVNLERVQVFSSVQSGLYLDGTSGPVSVNVRNSVISTTAGDGIVVTSGPFATQLMLDDVLVSENAQAGLLATGSGALIRVSNSTISGNLQGIQTTTGGQVISFGNNRIRGNVTDGAPTGTAPLQ